MDLTGLGAGLKVAAGTVGPWDAEHGSHRCQAAASPHVRVTSRTTVDRKVTVTS